MRAAREGAEHGKVLGGDLGYRGAPTACPTKTPHCRRAFADRANLRAHLRTRSDVTKHRCHPCARICSGMVLLARHEEGGRCGGS